MATGLYRATDGLRSIRVTPATISSTWSHTTTSAPPTFIPATDTRMPGNVANLSRMLKAAEGETGRTPVPSHSQR